MVNELQEALNEAVDYLIDAKTSRMPVDKTITCEISECLNSLDRLYLVKYNGGKLKAYASGDSSYQVGTSVYVLVPLGDFTQKKVILGVAMKDGGNDNVSFIDGAMNDYNRTGSNVIEVVDDSVLNDGLSSWKKIDGKVLYKYYAPDEVIPDDYKPALSVDQVAFETYLKDAKRIWFGMTCQTQLPRRQILEAKGDYGVIVTLLFKASGSEEGSIGEETKSVRLSIDVSRMDGNPYQFSSPIVQSSMFDVDPENFMRVDSIVTFSRGFVDEDTPRETIFANTGSYDGNDIFLSAFQMYALRKIDAVDGDYRMSVSTPKGAMFPSGSSRTFDLSVMSKVTYKNTDDLTDKTTFYWFREDPMVTYASDDYQAYGGSGWRYIHLDKTSKDSNGNDVVRNAYNTSSMSFKKLENKAYENRYMCVAVYESKVILKSKFTLYNDDAKVSSEITSDLGMKFSFDRGKPKLTCLVNGKSSKFEDAQVGGRPDSSYKFVWSKSDVTGEVQYSQTIDELNAQIDSINEQLKKGDTGGKSLYQQLTYVRNQIDQLKGIDISGNVMTFPMNEALSSTTFSCAVYRHDNNDDDMYLCARPSITVENASSASSSDYLLTIVNGDQVFQYSETGVAPDSEKYETPQVILPLSVKFYDPAGIEVASDEYSLKWVVPLSDTLISVPSQLQVNPSNGRYELYVGGNDGNSQYPMAIKQTWDYSSYNNSIAAVVEYHGQKYRAYTDFTFAKVGDNGTNGTETVCRIEPRLDNDDVTNDILYCVSCDRSTFSGGGDGGSIGSLSMAVFHSGVRSVDSSRAVSWKMSGGNAASWPLSVNDGLVSLNTGARPKNSLTNLIVRASTSEDGQDYYAFYPIPVVVYENLNQHDADIELHKSLTLRQVLYNSDGRNPQYNHNQGISYAIVKRGTHEPYVGDFHVTWEVQGGSLDMLNEYKAVSDASGVFQIQDNVENTTSLSVAKTITVETVDEIAADDGTKSQVRHESEKVVSGRKLDGMKIDFDGFVEVVPDATYTGEYSNNIVIGKLYVGNSLVATAYVPIYMSLNRYGLSSLNKWDGNSVEINDDENYILAPQIGAGQKEKDNSFTGVVMGTMGEYGSDDKTVGLMGFASGEQSILLDAKNGSATFGLPDDADDGDVGNGRIRLVPYGDSEISGWRMGSRSLSKSFHDYVDSNGVTHEFVDSELDKPYGQVTSGMTIKAKDGKEYTLPSRAAGSNYPIPGATVSIAHQSYGMLLNALPAYLSVKGKPLDDKSGIAWDDVNTVLKKGDSVEVEINPYNFSAFTIYRHTPFWNVYDENNSMTTVETDKWHRYPLVGINSNGQFYTNAIENGNSSMGVGKIGAYGKTAAESQYVGVQFGYSGYNVVKMFIDAADPKKYETSPLFISSGTSTKNEYPRPMKVAADSFALYAGANASSVAARTAETTGTFLSLNGSEFSVGFKDNDSRDISVLSIPRGNNSTARLTLNNSALSVFSKGDSTMTTNGAFALHATGIANETIGGNFIRTVSGTSSLSTNNSYWLKVYAATGNDQGLKVHVYDQTTKAYNPSVTVTSKLILNKNLFEISTNKTDDISSKDDSIRRNSSWIQMQGTNVGRSRIHSCTNLDITSMKQINIQQKSVNEAATQDAIKILAVAKSTNGKLERSTGMTITTLFDGTDDTKNSTDTTVRLDTAYTGLKIGGDPIIQVARDGSHTENYYGVETNDLFSAGALIVNKSSSTKRRMSDPNNTGRVFAVLGNSEMFGSNYLSGYNCLNGTNGNLSLHVKGQGDKNGNTMWVETGNAAFDHSATFGENVGMNGSLRVGGKWMDQGWFDAIQNLYDNWRGGGFPRQDWEITNLATTAANNVKNQIQFSIEQSGKGGYVNSPSSDKELLGTVRQIVGMVNALASSAITGIWFNGTRYY